MMKVTLMALNSKNVGVPVAFISVDFLVLVFGPIHHQIRFRQENGKKFLGLLQYNIHFEQVCATSVKINYLDATFHSTEDKALCANFRLVTPELKKESSWSYSKVGDYNTRENTTNLKLDFSKAKAD